MLNVAYKAARAVVAELKEADAERLKSALDLHIAGCAARRLAKLTVALWAAIASIATSAATAAIVHITEILLHKGN